MISTSDVSLPHCAGRGPTGALREVRTGGLEFVDERPHPMLGIAGKTLVTFGCNAPNCGACVVKPT